MLTIPYLNSSPTKSPLNLLPNLLPNLLLNPFGRRWEEKGNPVLVISY